MYPSQYPCSHTDGSAVMNTQRTEPGSFARRFVIEEAQFRRFSFFGNTKFCASFVLPLPL